MTMLETWYDLAIRELSELTDPAKERLAEAEQTEVPELDQDDAEDQEPPKAA
jgi:hypothetical protein